MNLLLVRNDRLGDFMLAWPAFALARSAAPDATVSALVPEYTREMAELCPSIDRVMIDPGEAAGTRRLAKEFSRGGFDALVAIYSTARVGAAAWLARIPNRVAPATQIFQFFYNHRLRQRRSRSEKPEYEYNVDLMRFALGRLSVEAGEQPASPYLRFASERTAALRGRFVAEASIPAEHRLIMIHPGHGGSARNLTPAQYAELALGLRSRSGHTVVVCAGPGERKTAEAVSARIGSSVSRVYLSRDGIAAYARFIACADVFISGSTGPLHVAGALDVPTAAFYPRRRSATALRWQTLNREARRMAFCPPPGVGEEDMATVDVRAAAAAISNRYLDAA